MAIFQHALQQHTAAIKERSSRRSKFSHGGASPMVHINAPLFARTAATPQGGAPMKRPSDLSMQPLPGNREPQQQAANGSQSLNPYSRHAADAAVNTEPQMPGVGLRRRAANLGASPFMQQQSAAPGGGGGNGGQQAMQYHARQDGQARLHNAVQVESTIVEVLSLWLWNAVMMLWA